MTRDGCVGPGHGNNSVESSTTMSGGTVGWCNRRETCATHCRCLMDGLLSIRSPLFTRIDSCGMSQLWVWRNADTVTPPHRNSLLNTHAHQSDMWRKTTKRGWSPRYANLGTWECSIFSLLFHTSARKKKQPSIIPPLVGAVTWGGMTCVCVCVMATHVPGVCGV